LEIKVDTEAAPVFSADRMLERLQKAAIFPYREAPEQGEAKCSASVVHVSGKRSPAAEKILLASKGWINPSSGIELDPSGNIRV
jgi:hypothetical protein